MRECVRRGSERREKGINNNEIQAKERSDAGRGKREERGVKNEDRGLRRERRTADGRRKTED